MNDRKPLIKINDNDEIIVAPPKTSEKVCSNLHQAILYLRRK